MPPYVLLALIGALGYSFGSLFNKQAMAGGCGLFRITAYTVWGAALSTLPFAFFYSTPIPWPLWWQPLTASAVFTIGQVFFILALRTGDLSIVAPVSGAKPILNALLVALLLGVTVSMATWAACFLTAAALVILRTPNTTTTHSFLKTAAITMISSLSFALCDTCFQQWAGNWGVLRFSAITFSAASLWTCGLIPYFSKPWKQLPASTRRNALAGATLCAVPGFCIGFALGSYGHAPEVNVIYGARAVISILAVRFLGRRIGSGEQHLPRRVLLRRIIGTAVLMTAVGLVLFGSQ